MPGESIAVMTRSDELSEFWGETDTFDTACAKPSSSNTPESLRSEFLTALDPDRLREGLSDIEGVSMLPCRNFDNGVEPSKLTTDG